MYGAYRYGFNGKENDNEVKGSGNQQDYGMRIYDPRLGRFLSVDPLAVSYPWYTPYQFAGNMPIEAIDLDGLEPESPKKDGFWAGFGKSVLQGAIDIGDRVFNNPNFAGLGGGTLPSTGKPPTQADFKRYEINWHQQINPTWHIENFSANLVYGTSNFVGGVLDGDGARTAQSIPQLAGSYGLFLPMKFGKPSSSRSFIPIAKQGAMGESASVTSRFGVNLNELTKSNNFPTFDHFAAESGIATSSKTFNLSSPGYLANPATIRYAANGYLQKMLNYETKKWKGFTLDADKINLKQFHIHTIGEATPLQQAQLLQIQANNTLNGVRTVFSGSFVPGAAVSAPAKTGVKLYIPPVFQQSNGN
jgi:RHS repeat-associated protein